jgi:hypothetical protein
MAALMAAVVLVTLPGCATQPRAASRPARINHVVFVKLHDPADAPELISDCDAMLRTLPMVRRYYAGSHIYTGRATVESDYDVGAYFGFDTADDYAAYVVHPTHVELVTRWRSRFQWMRVYDVLDETP